MNSKRLGTLLGALAALSLSTTATAQPEVAEFGELQDNSVRYADRPLVDEPMTLRVIAGPTDPRTWTLNMYRGVSDYGMGFENYALSGDLFDFDEGGGNFGFSNTDFVFRTGVAFAPVENLEVGIGLPFATGGRTIDDIPVWATYRFLESETVEIGGRVAMFLPAETEFGMQFGVPVVVHMDTLRIDTGIFASMAFFGEDQGGVYGRLSIPARVSINITDALYVGGTLGFDIYDFNSFAMPFGPHVGYTLEINDLVFDLGLAITWPALIFAESVDTRSRVLHNPDKAADGNDVNFNIGANMAIQF